MSVYKIKSGIWRYEFQISGRRYTRCGFETKLTAQQALKAHKELFGLARGKSVYSISKFTGQKELVRTLFQAVFSQMDVCPPEVCRICRQKKKLIAHHEDYTVPFRILWVCRSCHNRRHAELGNQIGPKNKKEFQLKDLLNIFASQLTARKNKVPEKPHSKKIEGVNQNA